jgi:hypothetical protein
MTQVQFKEWNADIYVERYEKNDCLLPVNETTL